MLYAHDYSSVLDPARNYYDSASRGQTVNAINHLENFFKEADKEVVVEEGNRGKIYDMAGNVLKRTEELKTKFNPSLARMALQQAQCDITAWQTLAYLNNDVNEADFKQLVKNRVTANISLNSTPGLIEIDRRMRADYPKTFKKRLAITPYLMDGVQVVLRHKNEEKVSATEKVFGEDLGLALVKEFKKIKKFNYWIRKIFTRPFLRG